MKILKSLKLLLKTTLNTGYALAGVGLSAYVVGSSTALSTLMLYLGTSFVVVASLVELYLIISGLDKED